MNSKLFRDYALWVFVAVCQPLIFLGALILSVLGFPLFETLGGGVARLNFSDYIPFCFLSFSLFIILE